MLPTSQLTRQQRAGSALLLPTLKAQSGSGQPSATYIGCIPFADEEDQPMNCPIGAEAEGRLFTDLSTMPLGSTVTPNEKFYIRTRVSQLFVGHNLRSIRLKSCNSTFLWRLTDLVGNATPQGIRLMECAGNRSRGHFGLISAADWSGVSMSIVLDRMCNRVRHKRVLVSGFDRYAGRAGAQRGTSWIFSEEELRDTAAFLAVEMNASPLTPDRGAPIRLIVPGWYGCACVKWVNHVELVDEFVEATCQMKEYASRTHQLGTPHLARDYRPAEIELAVMPIRIEKWLFNNHLMYQVVGIQWGGKTIVERLAIQLGSKAPYTPVDRILRGPTNTWQFWTHAWHPQAPAEYTIRTRVLLPRVTSLRLEEDYYARKVVISEV